MGEQYYSASRIVLYCKLVDSIFNKAHLTEDLALVLNYALFWSADCWRSNWVIVAPFVRQTECNPTLPIFITGGAC
jgi:hypothetical protein